MAATGATTATAALAATEPWRLLTKLRTLVAEDGFAKKFPGVPSARGAMGNEMQNPKFSIALRPILAVASEVAGRGEEDEVDLEGSQRFAASLVDQLVDLSPEVDRAIGCIMGLVTGDATGAPLEFLSTDPTLPPYQMAKVSYHFGRPVVSSPGREAFLADTLDDKEQLVYEGEFNKFRLSRGQWTDDASMSLCLADSLLCRRTYHGGDCRVRFFWWWFLGYNNAFKFDSTPGRRSIGLGGNIAKSIDEVYDFTGKTADEVPARFTAAGEDAGNGSMMRLAPVPVRFHGNVGRAMHYAAEQSYATHPGPDAAACCKFMTFLSIRAMKRPAAADAAAGGETTMADFIEETIRQFKAEVVPECKEDTGIARLLLVLDCTPPSPKEHSWLWRNDILPTADAVTARGRKYNGYPVDGGYFGAYSMDGLAMSLWAMRRSTTFQETMLRVVNLLGDCDTTGAIAGQMAGAFYGYKAMSALPVSKRMVENVQQWDPFREIPLRAAMLYLDGVSEAELQVD